MGKRGRPLGFSLSEESKRAISEAKKGQRHRQETKDKISQSLVCYFRRRRPLSEEITNTYCRANNDEICDWIYEVGEELDSYTDVLTERIMRNKQHMEIACGNNIEFFSHDLNPEVLIMFKQQCEIQGINLDEAFDDALGED